MHVKTALLLFATVLFCLSSIQLSSAQEARHSRVGDPTYWTPECFLNCYKVYLSCIGKTFPPKRYNNEQMVEMFKDKPAGHHEVIEACSAKYHETIHIEDDARRTTEMNRLNSSIGLTSNFDLCVFSQCGAGGYYGSFNMNHMSYRAILDITNKKLDPDFDFYFEMNKV